MGEKLMQGKVVLVTGGSKGLGAALVRMFAAEGAKVAFTYLHSQDAARALEAELGDGVAGWKVDAADYAAAREVVEAAVERFGGLDALVNNAAAARHREFLALGPDDVEFTLLHAFMPAFNYAQAAARVMKERGGGSIVSIGSINGERGREGSMPYCAAKAAVEAMTKTVAKELGDFDIRCNVVSPGFIATDGQANTSALIKGLVLDECAIRRLTEPKDVGNLVLFLASDKARNITGQVYRIDCGQYI